MKRSPETYPSYYDTEFEMENFFPESLKHLLEGIIIGKDGSLKTASIGQAIMHTPQST